MPRIEKSLSTFQHFFSTTTEIVIQPIDPFNLFGNLTKRFHNFLLSFVFSYFGDKLISPKVFYLLNSFGSGKKILKQEKYSFQNRLSLSFPVNVITKIPIKDKTLIQNPFVRIITTKGSKISVPIKKTEIFFIIFVL